MIVGADSDTQAAVQFNAARRGQMTRCVAAARAHVGKQAPDIVHTGPDTARRHRRSGACSPIVCPDAGTACGRDLDGSAGALRDVDITGAGTADDAAQTGV